MPKSKVCSFYLQYECVREAVYLALLDPALAGLADVLIDTLTGVVLTALFPAVVLLCIVMPVLMLFAGDNAELSGS